MPAAAMCFQIFAEPFAFRTRMTGAATADGFSIILVLQRLVVIYINPGGYHRMRTPMAAGTVDAPMANRIPEKGIAGVNLSHSGMATDTLRFGHPRDLGIVRDRLRHGRHTSMAGSALAVRGGMCQAPATLGLGTRVTVIAGRALVNMETVNGFGEVFP